jgi:hypothetical protein
MFYKIYLYLNVSIIVAPTGIVLNLSNIGVFNSFSAFGQFGALPIKKSDTICPSSVLIILPLYCAVAHVLIDLTDVLHP